MPKRQSIPFLLACSIITLFYIIGISYAEEINSTDYKIKESSFGNTGSMSSSNFSLLGTLSQFQTGSNSSTTFKLNSGFLYFPKVTSPLLTASAGDSQVSLSWTASQGFLGTNIAGYSIGQSDVSGGPYTFTSVGNVTNAIRNSLTNGRTYYFIIRAQDVFGAFVANSSEVSTTPHSANIVTPPSGGGGGGGSDTSTPTSGTGITLKGLAYPSARIVILKDASLGKEVIADSDGNFQATFSVSEGIYSFGIYALDKDGFKSPTFGFTVNSRPGQTVTTSDIVVAPTITADKTIVKVGNVIKFFGYSYPISSVNIMINSEKEIIDKTTADKYGRWSYSLNSKELEKGDHTAKSQTVSSKILASSYSNALPFKVGDQDVLADNSKVKNSTCNTHGDINNDGKVNIVDFSILMYFWNKTNPSNPCANINKDGRVDLKDFSIMLYWWTGK